MRLKKFLQKAKHNKLQRPQKDRMAESHDANDDVNGIPVSPMNDEGTMSPADSCSMPLNDRQDCYLIPIVSAIHVYKSPYCIGRTDINGVYECDNKDAPIPEYGWFSVSRRHCQIVFEQITGTYLLEDLGSKNGTHVNGKSLLPYCPRPIYDGDQITFGECRFLFKVG